MLFFNPHNLCVVYFIKRTSKSQWWCTSQSFLSLSSGNCNNIWKKILEVIVHFILSKFLYILGCLSGWCQSFCQVKISTWKWKMFLKFFIDNRPLLSITRFHLINVSLVKFFRFWYEIWISCSCDVNLFSSKWVCNPQNKW